MKIPVPKEAVIQIMKDYNCPEEQAAKAYLDAQDKANETVKAFLAERFGSSRPADDEHKPRIYTPIEIKDHLDKYVIGQEEYKKRLSIAAAYHFTMIMHLCENPADEEDGKVKRFRKKNTVIAGPSGSGKTYCVEVLGDLLQVPTLIVDATDYTEAGFVGKSADDMIRELIDLAPGYNRKDQARFISQYGGLIFIDEIDKKAKDGALTGHDISREGFQRSVLKLIERKSVSINNPYSAASQIQEMVEQQKKAKASKQDSMVSTENILFILGGSFQRSHDDLDSIVKKRLKHKGRVHDDGSVEIKGFAAEEKKNGNGKLLSYYKKAESELEVTRELCEHPKDYLLGMLEKSPFVDYIDNFKKEYGIELILDKDVQNYLENYAHQNNIALSYVLKKFLSGASALNYMGIKEPFKVTKDMVQDEKYFDKLFSNWYENQKAKNAVKN